MKNNSLFKIKYTIRFNGLVWYLMDTKGNVVGQLTSNDISNLRNLAK